MPPPIGRVLPNLAGEPHKPVMLGFSKADDSTERQRVQNGSCRLTGAAINDCFQLGNARLQSLVLAANSVQRRIRHHRWFSARSPARLAVLFNDSKSNTVSHVSAPRILPGERGGRCLLVLGAKSVPFF